MKHKVCIAQSIKELKFILSSIKNKDIFCIPLNLSSQLFCIRNKILNLSKSKSLKLKGYRHLIRFSGTEPLVRILVEGPSKDKVTSIAKVLEKKVRLSLGQ